MTQNLSDPYKPYILASGQDPAQFVFDKLTEQHDYTDEDEYAVKVNARIPLTAIADQKGRLHFGLRARIKSKDRNNNFYEYTPLAGLPPLSGMNTVIYDKHLVQGKHYVPGTFVSNKWLGNVDLYNGSEYEAEADPSEYLVSNYKANEQIYAGYLRWDQNITQNLMFIAGARVEHTRVDYKGAYSLNEEYDNSGMNKMENNYTNVLPTCHVDVERRRAYGGAWCLLHSSCPSELLHLGAFRRCESGRPRDTSRESRFESDLLL